MTYEDNNERHGEHGAGISRDQLHSATVLPVHCVDPLDCALDVLQTDAPLPFDQELVETEIRPTADPTHNQSSYTDKPERQPQPDPLPRWARIDLDKVLPHPAIEPALRKAGIDIIHRPSEAFLTEVGIRRRALIEPIHLVRCVGIWYCFLGWELLRDAQRVLREPRTLLVSIHADIDLEALPEYLMIEQVAVPLRHQISGKRLNARVCQDLEVLRNNSKLFLQLGADQLARIMGKQLRWLRYRMAAAKVSKNHD
jgi:hypothetical protein